jgi:V/A-type H+-transporting ATPase subunit A
MLKTILQFHKQALMAIEAGVETVEIFKLAVREEIARAKYVPQDEINKIAQIRDTIEQQMKQLHASVAT